MANDGKDKEDEKEGTVGVKREVEVHRKVQVKRTNQTVVNTTHTITHEYDTDEERKSKDTYVDIKEKKIENLKKEL